VEELEACVLTKETQRGGIMINDAREAKGMRPLELVFANMILTEDLSSPRGDAELTSFSNKMSSTLIRQYLSCSNSEKRN